MTQPGETDGMMGTAHLRAVERHIGAGLIHTVLYSATTIPAPLLAHYAETGSEPVAVERESMARSGVELVGADLLEPLRLRPVAAAGQ